MDALRESTDILPDIARCFKAVAEFEGDVPEQLHIISATRDALREKRERARAQLAQLPGAELTATDLVASYEMHLARLQRLDEALHRHRRLADEYLKNNPSEDDEEGGSGGGNGSADMSIDGS
jgi:hypothetical protein